MTEPRSKLDKLSCSEAAAYLLKAVGILNEREAADEYMPNDFRGEDPYEKEVRVIT